MTRQELRMDTKIDGFDVKNVMLDLGSDVNVLVKASWEALRRPNLVYSPIQWRMENKYCIFPIRYLEYVEVNVASVKTVTTFQFIDIIGGNDPYSTLLGIDWDFENYAIIDLKRELMIFESNGLNVTFPLDPYQGPSYTEPAQEALETDVIDQLY